MLGGRERRGEEEGRAGVDTRCRERRGPGQDQPAPCAKGAADLRKIQTWEHQYTGNRWTAKSMVVPEGLRESVSARRMQGSNWCGRCEAAGGLKCAEWGGPSSSRKGVGRLAIDIKLCITKTPPAQWPKTLVIHAHGAEGQLRSGGPRLGLARLALIHRSLIFLWRQ